MEDGANQGAIVSAVSWIQGGLAGSLASTIAVIAVAFLGLLLLSGRLEMRRAIHVLFGCFILFGASSIASGLMQFMMETGRGAEAPDVDSERAASGGLRLLSGPVFPLRRRHSLSYHDAPRCFAAERDHGGARAVPVLRRGVGRGS